MKTDEMKFSGCLGILGAIPVMIFVATLVNAMVTATLWGWFIVPVFGLPPLGLAEAAGLSLIVSYLAKGTEEDSDQKSKDISTMLSISLIRLLFKAFFSLLMGWIIYQFVGG